MRLLHKAFSFKNNIEKVNAESLKDAVRISFSDNRYKFYLNSELIDVNNRFRVFDFEGISYIVKKVSASNGKKELELATKAKSILNNTVIENIKINVVAPCLEIIGKESYIITNYKGVSLQECLYSNEITNPLTIDNLFKILNKFMELGILYRGFLPRNTVLIKDDIYLLDWEDVIFCDNSKDNFVNTLWETNFLLNWSYLYPLDDLKKRIRYFKNGKNSEPKLIKYEKKFGEWIKYTDSDTTLRHRIMETVLFAEKKLETINDKFCIMPNDMAHLISDLFNYDIDVIFDISSFILRRRNEKNYRILLVILSDLILELFKDNIKIQPYAIVIIFVIIEHAIDNKKILKITNFKNIDQLFRDINLNNYTVAADYIKGNNIMLLSHLQFSLSNLIRLYNNSRQKIELDINEIFNYIVSLKNQVQGGL